MSIAFELDEAAVNKYEALRYSKRPGYIVLKIENEKIVVENEGELPIDEFRKELPDEEPRFILYDAPVKNRVGMDDKRMVFIVWMPMEAPVRLRMTYAGSKNRVRDQFQGISATIQFDEKSEMTLERVQNAVMRRQGINV